MERHRFNRLRPMWRPIQEICIHMSTETARATRATEGFGTREVVSREEIGVASAQAIATAAVQARYIMALRNPRNEEMVEACLVRECQRPGFALSARYSRPVGGGKVAEGWSIRFAESCARSLGHIELSSRAIHEDADSVVYQFSVNDLQNNMYLSEEVAIPKTVERLSAEGRVLIGQRKNSQGKTVYIVRATAEEINVAVKVAQSKAYRAVIRLVPGDVLDRCEAEVQATVASLPPRQKIDLLLRGFAQVGIQPVDLQQWLGRPLQRKAASGMEYTLTADEIEELVDIGAALRAKEVTWQQVMADKNPAGSEEQAQAMAEAKIEKLRKAADEFQRGAETATDAPTAAATPTQSMEDEVAEFDRQQAQQQEQQRRATTAQKGKLTL